MNFRNTADCEKNQLEKLKKYQLPHFYKKIGISITLLAFVVLLARKFAFPDIDYVQQLAKNGMLVGLLIIIISKEKIEDELIRKLRGQAFSFAFIAGVIYTLVMPLTDFVVDLFISSNEASYKEIGDFMVLWFMMVMYLAFFTVLKKAR